MTGRLTEGAIVVASEHQVSAALSESATPDVVVLDLNDGIYYELSNVGARVWELVQSPRSVGAILESLLEEYEVDRGRCEADLLALLEEMAKRGLIAVRQPTAG